MNKVIENVMKHMERELTKEQLSKLEVVLNKEMVKEIENNVRSNEKLLEEFLASKVYENCSSETVQQYKRENKKFLIYIGKRVEDIDKKDVERYLARYREERKVSDRTLNNARAFISAFLII